MERLYHYRELEEGACSIRKEIGRDSSGESGKERRTAAAGNAAAAAAAAAGTHGPVLRTGPSRPLTTFAIFSGGGRAGSPAAAPVRRGRRSRRDCSVRCRGQSAQGVRSVHVHSLRMYVQRRLAHWLRGNARNGHGDRSGRDERTGAVHRRCGP